MRKALEYQDTRTDDGNGKFCVICVIKKMFQMHTIDGFLSCQNQHEYDRVCSIAKEGNDFWNIEKEYLPVVVLKRAEGVLAKQIRREIAKKGATNAYIYESLNPNFMTKVSAVQDKFLPI